MKWHCGFDIKKFLKQLINQISAHMSKCFCEDKQIQRIVVPLHGNKFDLGIEGHGMVPIEKV